MLRAVMAGREKRGGNRLTCLHLDAADLKRLQRQPAGLHDRRVVAQHLLDGIGYELGLGAQFGELIRMFEQRKHAIADEVRSGKIASDKQEVAGNDNLALGQPILRPLGRDERTNKVSAAPTASLIYRTGEIIIEALPRCRQQQPWRKSMRTKTSQKKARGRSVNALQKPLQPSEELAAVIGSRPLARGQVVSKIWHYIRSHNLQNPENRREILVDDKLRKVFGKDKVTMFEMNKHLAQHLR